MHSTPTDPPPPTMIRCHNCGSQSCAPERVCAECGADPAEWDAWRRRNQTEWAAVRVRIDRAIRGGVVCLGAWFALALAMTLMAVNGASAMEQWGDAALRGFRALTVAAGIACALRIDLAMRSLPSWSLERHTSLHSRWLPAGALTMVAAFVPVILGAQETASVGAVRLALSGVALFAILRTLAAQRSLMRARVQAALPVVGRFRVTRRLLLALCGVGAIVLAADSLRTLVTTALLGGPAVEFGAIVAAVGEAATPLVFGAWAGTVLAMRFELAQWVDGRR